MGSINIIKPLLSTALSSSADDKLTFFFNKNFFWGTPGIKPGAIGSGTVNAYHCAMPPPFPIFNIIQHSLMKMCSSRKFLGVIFIACKLFSGTVDQFSKEISKTFKGIIRRDCSAQLTCSAKLMPVCEKVESYHQDCKKNI